MMNNTKAGTSETFKDDGSLGSHDSDASFADKSMHSSTRTTTTDKSSSEDEKLFAKKETQAVLRLRLLVFDFLIIATIAISLIVYFTTSGSERSEYETQYESAAKKVIEAFMDIAQTQMAAVAALSVTLGIAGEEQNSSNGNTSSSGWPFVTLKRFQERASATRSQSGSLYLHVNPLVTRDERQDWELYVTGESSHWIEEGLEYQDNTGMLNFTDMPDMLSGHNHVADRWPIWFRNLKGLAVTDKGDGPYLPTWMTSPILYNGQEVNENILKNARAYIAANKSFASQSVVVDKLMMATPGDMDSEDPDTSLFALLMSIGQQEHVDYPGDAFSQVFYPIFDAVEGRKHTVGIIVAWIRWLDYFKGILPTEMKGINFILKDSCGGNYTYVIDGDDVRPIGAGDQHQGSYSEMRRSASLASLEKIDDGTQEGVAFNRAHCIISIEVYPSNTFHAIYNTNMPAFMTAAVVVIFVCTALLFIAYDRLVERRQKLVMASARQTNAIVTSLFPKSVRDQLMLAVAPVDSKGKLKGSFMAPNRRLQGFLSGDQDDDIGLQPIAELYPHCTVCFSDISGFTAWSSTRDPAQVFILLQTVYQAFDKIAQRRRVFKVETIGDTYVSVTGLPEPQPNHAVIMARFAAECRAKMNELVHELETSLGPDTAELSMRFGMHSGPVTAGVLRGERARFQLFGDTVNTASRMESTGERDMIQISHVTYGLLVEAGKQSWVKPRIDKVSAKGKGTMRTYWLHLTARRVKAEPHNNKDDDDDDDDDNTSAGLLLETGSVCNLDVSTSHIPTSISTRPKSEAEAAIKKQARLVDWMCELFHDHIRQVMATRKSRKSKVFKGSKAKYSPKENQTSLDEVAEVIYLPRFDSTKAKAPMDVKDVHVGPVVMGQLHDYISIIASKYHNNPFHNFEHASHVTMTVSKFLKRIATPDINMADGDMASKLHEYTHGINSDPLTIFAIVFSALIHDVDHRGVSNTQLIKEHKEMGDKYRNKSVAEQNSLDLSWNLLMEDRFEDLRNCMFSSDTELQRFRQVIVNVVLATDIFDPELNGLRKKRWEKAFCSSDALSHDENNDLRATIVIEHIIQASDVSHTMQHWHIYRKWNKRLFQELYSAYCEGRMEKDPSSFWYKGEIGFFDNYVIPLAKKLKDCQVFGVSSDECLNYAICNRDEWKEKGEQIVAEMMHEVAQMDLRPV